MITNWPTSSMRYSRYGNFDSMKILIACDKFKGSLTAPEACEAVASGISKTLGSDTVEMRQLPVADGGDGLALSLTTAGSGKWVTHQVSNALGQPIDAGYGIIESGRTAVIEMAEASGLAQLNATSLYPWKATTFGTGELILDAMDRGVEKIILGIGGSATNDGGTGMASAMGFQFLDKNGRVLDAIPTKLEKAASIVTPKNLNLPRFTVACDVTNPLLGPSGCTTIYGPQKGIIPDDLSRHEKRLAHLVGLTGDHGRTAADQPGAGAAGGLGFGCLVFFNARLVRGFDLVADILQLDEAVQWADLVITGEGKLDSQSCQGKAPHGVAQLAQRHGKSTAAFCGFLESRELEKEFGLVCEIRDPKLSIEENMRQGANHLRSAAAQFIAPLIFPST